MILLINQGGRYARVYADSACAKKLHTLHGLRGGAGVFDL